MHDLKILLCDDSLLVRKKLKGLLENEGFTRLLEAADGEEAVAVCKTEKPDVVLLDIVMPKKDGLEALQEIKEIDPSCYVVIASSVGTQSNLIKAIKLGADDFLQKPITIESVQVVLIKAAQKRGIN